VSSQLIIAADVDRTAGTAYLRFLDHPVKRTEEFDDVTMVDLDEFDVVVGIEFLDLETEVQIDQLLTKYHISSEAASLLRMIEESGRRQVHVDARGSIRGRASYGALQLGSSSGPWVAGVRPVVRR